MTDETTYDVTIRTRSGAEHHITGASENGVRDLRTLTELATPGSPPLHSTLLLANGSTVEIMRNAIESVSWRAAHV